jgi:hypothetical protein
MFFSGLFVGAVLLVGFVLAGAVGQTWGPVSRARLARFASRHRLTITVDNGEQVIRYLAQTRRWRSAGLVVGAVVSSVASIPHGTVRVDFLALLAGWFVGALVAEVRLAAGAGALGQPGRRVASLRSRNQSAYLGPVVRGLLPAAVALSTGTAVVTGVVDGAPHWRYLAVWLTGLAVAGSVAWVARRVLRRRQPVLAPDGLAADEAIRSRSLHVLYAAGATLVLYCVLFQLAQLGPLLAPGSSGYTVVTVAAGLGIFAVPLLGWYAATSRWIMPGPPPVPVVA